MADSSILSSSNTIDEAVNEFSPSHHLNRRWYIIFATFMLLAVQTNAYNTFGTIADTAKFAYGWSNADVDFLTNSGNLSAVLCALPCIYIVYRFGVRFGSIFSVLVVYFGIAVRCVAILDMKNVLVYMTIGQVLNGLPAVTINLLPSPVAHAWFAPGQRGVALAIAFSGWSVGSMIGFLISPLFVSDNNTDSSQAINQIQNLFYFDAAWGAIVFILFVMYFPSHPPSAAGGTEEQPEATSLRHFFTGLVEIFRSKLAVLLIITYNILNGPFYSWQSNIVYSMALLPISQSQINVLSFFASLLSTFSPLLYGIVLDKCTNRVVMLFIFASLGLCFIMYTIFTLVSILVIPYSLAIVYVAFLLAAAVCVGITIPIYEFLTKIPELAHIKDSTMTGLLQVLNTVAGFAFLLFAQLFACSGSSFNQGKIDLANKIDLFDCRAASSPCAVWPNYYMAAASVVSFATLGLYAFFNRVPSSFRPNQLHNDNENT